MVRGFNNIFSGGLLTLTDNRIARVPSLRLNAYNFIPVTNDDIERIEVVLGPGSAVYGPSRHRWASALPSTCGLRGPIARALAMAGPSPARAMDDRSFLALCPGGGADEGELYRLK